IPMRTVANLSCQSAMRRLLRIRARCGDRVGLARHVLAGELAVSKYRPGASVVLDRVLLAWSGGIDDWGIRLGKGPVMPQAVVDGLTTNYEVEGEGEPLLLIPYTSADHACYAFQFPAYAEQFRCIAIDLPGSG